MYNNLFDAFVKTYADDSKLIKKKKLSLGDRFSNTAARLRRFYTGMSIYGGTYIGFIAIEFSLYETLLRKIETECEGKSLLGTAF
mmetsp:Transcript_24017/g.32212  ORF Transcript_24017/g.32212 Transcript_24017/m.32212 type:complete len:85 (-) Transcript_24017:527-781(-)